MLLFCIRKLLLKKIKNSKMRLKSQNMYRESNLKERNKQKVHALENTPVSQGRQERPIVMEGCRRMHSWDKPCGLRTGGHKGTSGEALHAHGCEERQMDGNKQ